MAEADTEPINVAGSQPVQRVSTGVLAGVSLWRLVIVASALSSLWDSAGVGSRGDTVPPSAGASPERLGP